MEVSSHGLDQFRVNGTEFDTAVFTNLTRDHLDYHGDMQSYGAVKSRLFYWHDLRHAVVNVDDAFGRELAAKLRRDRPSLGLLGYGCGRDADIAVEDFRASDAGSDCRMRTPWGEIAIRSELLGRFNAMNLAACVGVLGLNGFSARDIVRALSGIRAARGRMQRVSAPGEPLVVVDYAHTPDALSKAIAALRESQKPGAKLWCVFGCGGDRDRGKRPMMGAAAGAADCPVVTSDNPRSEDPQKIIDDILPAMTDPVFVHVDRAVAIDYAVTRAAPGDTVLIAGKGHEDYQDIAGHKHHFDDAEEARAALARRKS